MISETINFVRETLGYPNQPIHVEFNSRFTRRMGDANVVYGIGIIRLSRKLWDRASEEQKREVIIHEACHVIQRVRDMERGCRSSAHGEHWKSLMRKCGVRPNRCHTVDRTGLVKTYPVRCSCGVNSVGKTVYRRLREGTQYRCCKCNDKIEPAG